MWLRVVSVWDLRFFGGLSFESVRLAEGPTLKPRLGLDPKPKTLNPKPKPQAVWAFKILGLPALVDKSVKKLDWSVTVVLVLVADAKASAWSRRTTTRTCRGA